MQQSPQQDESWPFSPEECLDEVSGASYAAAPWQMTLYAAGASNARIAGSPVSFVECGGKPRPGAQPAASTRERNSSASAANCAARLRHLSRPHSQNIKTLKLQPFIQRGIATAAQAQKGNSCKKTPNAVAPANVPVNRGFELNQPCGAAKEDFVLYENLRM